MKGKKIIAIFDFCETLVDFQTAARFLEIIKSHNPNYDKHIYLKAKILRRLYKYTNIKLFAPKVIKYPQLQGFGVEKAEQLAKDFVQNELLARINKKVLKRLEFHQESGHTTAIVSGGFEIYIKEFAKIFGIEHTIAISLDSHNGILSGQIDGIHTMEYRKLYKLTQTLDMSAFDLNNSYAYSDCPSDIPLLSFVGKPTAIQCGKDLRWAHILGYEIL